MKDLSIIELYNIKKRMIKEGMSNDPLMIEVLESIKIREDMIFEDTSATGGGMGSVVAAQPSGLAGATIGPNWGNNGGTVGSGDVSMPYNSGSNKNMFQQVEMGKNHGSRTGKKSRKKKLDIKALKDVFSKRQDYTNGEGNDVTKPKKVMSFEDFYKNDINKVKK